MKFFVDTANLEDIQKAHALGVLDGVTTNPSLMKKAGDVDFHQRIYDICEAVGSGDVSAEVTGTEHDEIMSEARELAQIHENVVVKVPLIEEGIKALKTCSEEGIRTNCTLCFSSAQALLAAKAGADYISPFLGRLDDIGHEGMELIREIRTIYDNYEFETEILAASIRHPAHVREAALAGADVATVPFEVFGKLLQHPLTDRGLERFLDDWADYEEALAAEQEEAAAPAAA